MPIYTVLAESSTCEPAIFPAQVWNHLASNCIDILVSVFQDKNTFDYEGKMRLHVVHISKMNESAIVHSYSGVLV